MLTGILKLPYMISAFEKAVDQDGVESDWVGNYIRLS